MGGFLCVKLLLTLLFLFSAFYVTEGTWDPEKEAKLNSFVNALMNCRDTVGMFVSLVKDGQVSYTGGYGFRNIEEQLPVTSTTKFNIGSLSKAFTSILAAEAINESPGVTWDTPMVDILGSSFALQDEFRTSEATIKDMFSHKMGMPTYYGLSTAGMNITREEMIMQRMRHFPVKYPFRRQFNYSNYLYMIGSYVTEVIKGKPWEQHVYDTLIGPIGMSDTRISPDMTSPEWANATLSYTQINGEFTPNPEEDQLPFLDEIAPGGGIFSTAEDMAKYMLFHLDKGKNSQGEQVVPEAVLSQTYSPATGGSRESPRIQKPAFPVDDMRLTYGMGWWNGMYRGMEKIYHTGSYSSYECYLRLLPEVEAGACACVNSPGDNRASPVVLLATIYGMDLILDEEPWLNDTTACTYPEPWARENIETNLQDVPKSPNLNSKNTEKRLLSEYAGTYNHPAFGDFVVTHNQQTDELTYAFGMLLSGDLKPSANKDDFHMTLNHPLTYRMAFFPQFPEGFPVYFTSSGGVDIDTVIVPYFELDLPPVFTKI